MLVRKNVLLNFLRMLIVLHLVIVNTANAALIEHSLKKIDSSSYEVEFAIFNTSSAPVKAFTLYFDYDFFAGISITSTPADWDSFAVQPDQILGVNEPGFADFYSSTVAIGPNNYLKGVLITFDWNGMGEIASAPFYFETYDPSTFAVLSSGYSTLKSVSVNEPKTLVVFLLVLIVVISKTYVRSAKP
ncbi:hypothetical protein ACYTPF_12510 [Alteromonas sp. HB246098]